MSLRLLLLSCVLCVFWAPAGAVHTYQDDSPYAGLTAQDLAGMHAKAFEKHTGTKLNLKEKLVYGYVRKQVKKGLRKGTLEADQPVAQAAHAAAGSFNIGAFLLGFLLGLIGLAIVLLAFRDRDAWRSAILGWALWVLILLVIVLA